MKRIISGISALIICLNFTISVSLATDGFAGGSGTQSDPYLISTAAQLERVRYDRFAHYKLQNDIVFTSADFAEGGAFFNGGEGFFPLCSGGDTFRGVLDGNGHKIRNLYINRSMSTYAKVGLFGDNRGTIKNLGLENARISVNALGAISTIDVGGIAGWNEGRIENCHITGEITVTSEAWYTGLCVGGMAGENMNGQVIDCDNKARISGESVYSVNVGGLVGLTNGGSVTKCYNQGALSGKSVYYEAAISVGGIAAIGSETTISDCYNIGA
ncbi:MAG: hypothetical protein IJN42_02475, partial [Clostridia bacterium]|nr:hypothetical protein [Clostridia bacterium]